MGRTPGDARRDFSPPANAAYHGPVPQMLMDYLVKHKNSLFPELYKVWGANGFRTSGSWEEVFGKSEFRPELENWQFCSFYSEELFSAWNYASYVEKVAGAGKKEYRLPMYVNAWLKQPYSYWPGRYPSGGPLPQVLDVWRAAAPSIDFIAPDIYMDEFTMMCREYTRGGNPLFIPETRAGSWVRQGHSLLSDNSTPDVFRRLALTTIEAEKPTLSMRVMQCCGNCPPLFSRTRVWER
jgi:hypothetical protein